MRRRIYIGLLFLGVVSSATLGWDTANGSTSDSSKFKQWIAPLECTREEIVNGVNQTYILTPEECDDFLNPDPTPTPPEQTPGGPSESRAWYNGYDLSGVDSFQWQGRELVGFPHEDWRQTRDRHDTSCDGFFSSCNPLWVVVGAAAIIVVVRAFSIREQDGTDKTSER